MQDSGNQNSEEERAMFECHRRGEWDVKSKGNQTTPESGSIVFFDSFELVIAMEGCVQMRTQLGSEWNLLNTTDARHIGFYPGSSFMDTSRF